MKPIFQSIIISVLIFVIIFLLSMFVLWEPDLSKWKPDERLTTVLVAVLCSMCSFLISITHIDEINNKK